MGLVGIITTLVILFVSVTAIAIVQKREQEKAKLRQKISQYKYRANKASATLSNFSHLPIGPEARQIMMRYCLLNLKAVAKLSPSDSMIEKQIESLNQEMQNTSSPADKQRLKIPSDLAALNHQINQLSSLAKFILQLNKKSLAPSNQASVAIQKIMALISESKVCAYIQQGRDSLSKHEYVPAQRSFTMAQQMLAKISTKSERLISLESELHELIKSTPAQARKTQLDFDAAGLPKDPQKGFADETSEEHDELFGPRKKW